MHYHQLDYRGRRVNVASLARQAQQACDWLTLGACVLIASAVSTSNPATHNLMPYQQPQQGDLTTTRNVLLFIGSQDSELIQRLPREFTTKQLAFYLLNRCYLTISQLYGLDFLNAVRLYYERENDYQTCTKIVQSLQKTYKTCYTPQ